MTGIGNAYRRWRALRRVDHLHRQRGLEPVKPMCPNDPCRITLTRPMWLLVGTCDKHAPTTGWFAAFRRALQPVDRVVGRWLDWDGDCGKPVDLWIGDAQFRCARPVTRIVYVLFGRGIHSHSPRKAGRRG